MPIKPENRALYPDNWKQIRIRILRRAENRCERCGVENHVLGARTKSGKWMYETEIDSLNSTEGEMLFGEYPNIIMIVLTVAHLDHNPANCSDDNLQALCQRCHLRYDSQHHQRNARTTRRSKRALGELFNAS